MDEIKIAKERIAILIGKKGEIKRRIARLTNTKIKVDSKEGDVIITGEDGLGVYTAKQIVQAIARGFNPDKALSLLDDENIFEIINIRDYARNTRNDLKRIKARVIGREGKAKEMIEYLTNVDLSIYGKTIAMIGKVEDVDIARHALNNLLAGSRHGKVYAYLQRQRELKKTGAEWQKT